MRCEKCRSTGWEFYKENNGALRRGPCPDCNGTGYSYCCEGHQNQRHAEEEE